MIEPTTYLRQLEGKSNAHLITFSDGNDYVVKYFQNGFEKSLPNEWVAYCLGRYLGLPIPFAKIVEIPKEFSSQVPELLAMSVSQHQFASLYIPNCIDGHESTTVSYINNHQSLAGIIVFDYWLANRDRTRKNILLRQESGDSYRIWIIDQAEVFDSYSWLQSDLENLPVEMIKSATHQMLASFIDDENQFFKEVQLIQSIPILLIEEIVDLIPDDWNVSKDEKKAMVTALVTRRKKILPDLLSKFIKKMHRPQPKMVLESQNMTENELGEFFI